MTASRKSKHFSSGVGKTLSKGINTTSRVWSTWCGPTSSEGSCSDYRQQKETEFFHGFFHNEINILLLYVFAPDFQEMEDGEYFLKNKKLLFIK